MPGLIQRDEVRRMVDEAGVVLGRLRAPDRDVDDDTPVAELMYEGPSTVRPAEDVDALVHRMHHADVEHVLVTRADGVLVGIFEREAGIRDHETHAH